MKPASHETPKSKPPTEKKPRLSLVVDSKKGGREEELTSVKEMKELQEGVPEQLFLLDMAGQFLALAKVPSQGLKLAEAGWQNIITRARHNGLITNVEKFQRDFKDALNAMMGGEDVAIGDKPISLYAREVFDGIETNVNIIKELEQGFLKKRPSPETQQLIAINDQLDAGNKIDLVEVLYRNGEAAPEVDRVRFLQVKKSIQPEIEVLKNHQAHESFLRSMMEETEQRRAFKSRELESFMRITKREFTLDQLQPSFEPLLKSLQNIEATDDQSLGDILSASKVPAAVFKTWFADQDPKSVAALQTLVQGSLGGSVERANALYAKLSRYSLAHPPTSGEIVTAKPDWHSARTILGAANFESLMVHGGKVEIKKLSIKPGERKALTAA